MNTRTIDIIGYEDGTWSLREHGSLYDIVESGEELKFATAQEARQYAQDSGWMIVEYDT